LKRIPLSWIIDNYLDFTPEQLKSMEVERKKEYVALGFKADGTNPNMEEEQDLNNEMMKQQIKMGDMEMQQGMMGGEEEDDEYSDYRQPQQPQRGGNMRNNRR
jgi:hypothetical protein